MKRFSVIVALLVILVPVALFASGSKETSTSSAAQKVTLTLWDNATASATHAIMQEVIKEFESANPGVTVEETSRPLEETTTAIMAAVNAGSGPDILQANNGESQMGPMVRAGQLLNLDPYSQKWGWEKKYLSPSLWDRAKYTTDGKTFGTGSLYAVPLWGEFVGVFYNKDIFSKLGLSVPQTLGQFETTLAKVKAAGITPIAFGGADIWPFFQTFADVLSAVMSDSKGSAATQKWFSDAVINSSPNVTWDDPSVIEAAKIFKSWVDKGYFFKDFTGLNIDTAASLFAAGKAAMFLQGTWYAPQVGKASFKSGMFPFPPVKQSEALIPQVGGMATPQGVNAATKYKDLSAAFLNTMLDSATVHKMLEDNYLLPPVVPLSLSGVPKDSLFYDLGTIWNQMNEQDRVGQYLDWTTPDMGAWQGGQQLETGAITPEQFAHNMEQVYKAWLKKRASM